jgi:hypothetical protein
VKLIRIIAYPFVFLLSWNFWFHGHVASILMDMFEAKWWFDAFFGIYQFDMQVSADLQDLVHGKGKLWPWGEVITKFSE